MSQDGSAWASISLCHPSRGLGSPPVGIRARSGSSSSLWKMGEVSPLVSPGTKHLLDEVVLEQGEMLDVGAVAGHGPIPNPCWPLRL